MVSAIIKLCAKCSGTRGEAKFFCSDAPGRASRAGGCMLGGWVKRTSGIYTRPATSAAEKAGEARVTHGKGVAHPGNGQMHMGLKDTSEVRLDEWGEEKRGNGVDFKTSSVAGKGTGTPRRNPEGGAGLAFFKLLLICLHEIRT